MNTPNKLTLLRVILIPVYMILYLSCGQIGTYLAIAVFLLASLTDQLDGYLARKNNQVTTFGKLMDPLADKMLMMSALISFVAKDLPYISAGVVVTILARELIVTGIRLIALGENEVIAASMWGKAKTVSQMVLVIGVMVFEVAKWYLPNLGIYMDWITLAMTVVAVVLTVYSGFDYIWKNRKLIQFK